MALTPTRANIVVSGINTIKLRQSGDTEFINLPYLRNGKISEKTIETFDSTKRNFAHAVELTVEAEMFAVNDLTNCIELLDSLGSLDYDFQVTAKNGTTWDTSLLTPTLGGLKWTLVCEKDMEDLMFLKLLLDRRYLVSQIDTIHGTPTVGSAGTAAIANMATLTPADIGVGGIREIALGQGSYTDTATNLVNSKFTAELLTKKDQYGRSRGYNIKVDYEADCFQAAAADILDLNVLAAYDIDVRVTLINGRIFTFDSKLGFRFDVKHDADSDDTSLIHLAGSGIVNITDWDGIVT